MIFDRTLETLKRGSALLDGQFRIPGTRVTFGVDPLVGLIPGLGDLVTPIFTAMLIVHAVRAGLP